MTGGALDGKRAKRIALLALVAGAGIAILAWSQTWFTFEIALDPGTTPGSSRGETAAPALMALALAGLAGVAGLALAGPVFRIVLGALEALLGGTVLLVTGVALASPLGAVSADVAEKTGVSGVHATSALVVEGSLVASPWPWVAILAGVVLVAAGCWTIATGRRWPGSSRKYGARFEDTAGGDAAPRERAVGDDRVDQWDALSHGDDPTGADAVGAEPPTDATIAPDDAVDDGATVDDGTGTEAAPTARTTTTDAVTPADAATTDPVATDAERREPDDGAARDR
ncbi:Trp biosynthesis-associated membrane protein [Pseudoclavibacter chungangensis]|uniref:Trp biosynthesis-associated membrane protein n=1 Tax=Pseudoclavibacter chungangensis TaxID=587635 RepID=A0A7J5BU37_9MICO|nr:Trp biosynthesis-associated membrane protein [Pseudoclavibacter chungangensis]KAB1657834.1 Trp biosynthesis-associated membrane protein [Pseudoclavibacter chungangensis]NYJ66568.1 putative membrane protein (TIGR02234 family) [Pseudoclavibacter chungangensis]